MSSFAPASISTSVRNEEPPPTESDLMDSDEAEEEVDQLESDTDAEAPVAQKAPALVRPPGKSLLPANRVENIIQAEGVTGSLAMSKEGQFVLSIATEEFIKRMVEAGHMKAKSERRSTVTYADMAYTTQQYQEFMFLEDTIPPPMPLLEALQLRREKEQEMLDDNPAMAITAPAPATNPYPSITPSTTASTTPKSKAAKPKASQSNGQDQPGGQSASTKREKKPEQATKTSSKRKEKDATSSAKPKPSATPAAATNGAGSASAAGASPAPHATTSTPPKTSASAILILQPPKDEMDVEEGPSSTSDPAGSGKQSPNAARMGQFTGPASGFLQGPGRPLDQQNPGRTIYSDSSA